MQSTQSLEAETAVQASQKERDGLKASVRATDCPNKCHTVSAFIRCCAMSLLLPRSCKPSKELNQRTAETFTNCLVNSKSIYLRDR